MTGAVLRITARRHGWRRAGLAHPGHPVDHPRDRFSEDQVRQLLADPELVVQEISVFDTLAPPDPDSEGFDDEPPKAAPPKRRPAADK